ncbi:MAG TPA: LysM peptidoglycan-binding domain-containing protein [Anaerolineales bacterium]|nr:LysM peptidoglycan-binding domain-containing protein [Anaerolineales bacterium]
MHKTSHGWLPFVLILGVILASACTQTYSQAPLATPTLISTGLFVSPFPSGQDPLQVVAGLGTQTAAAKTAQAGGGTTTPGTAAVVSGTPATQAPASPTPTLGTAAATSATTSSATTSSASTVVPATQRPTQQITTPLATSVVNAPSSYTLQQGEFPYCLARRFNVNPDQLLSANGITDSTVLYPGKALTIPQSAGAFPGDRAWHNHPTTYTVPSADTTLYGVACWFGDVYPQDIASANGLTLSSALTTGQQLTIP